MGTAAINPVAYSSAAISPVAYSTYNRVVSHVNPVVSYAATPVVASTHQVTNYDNPHHYTAVSNGVFGPKYIAKNHRVEHVAKRSADPYFYSANPAAYAAGHVVKGVYAPHAVAATPFGYAHSSNVGVCTNNMGVQVPC